MGRIVVIDKTIIDQINYGNGDAARAVLGLLRGKAELWITAEARAQLFREAESRLMTDLGVRSPLQDVNSDHDYEKKLHPGGDGSRSVPNKSAKSATLALSKGAEVLTADRVFANTYRGIGGKVAAESGNITALPEVKPFDMNYNVGRRLLGLRDLNLGPNGRILPPVRPATPARPAGPPAAPPATTGPRTNTGARTTKNITATRGDPVQAPTEHGPSAKGDAKFQGATLTLKGVDFVVQWINDRIQARRLAEKWNTMKPTVERTLDADPQLGALIRVYYSKAAGDAESAIDTVRVYQDVRVAYGMTREDALRRYNSENQMTARGDGALIVDDTGWYAPRQAIDVRKLPTPFRSLGVATFRRGKEKLTRVKFSVAMGFDDKMYSKEVLNVPAGTSPRFLYLLPPDEITYFDFKYKKAGVDWDMSMDPDTSQVRTDAWFKGVPAVMLDSWANPSDATASMVWPADNATATLFKSTSATDDGGVLKGLGIGLMRWVKPEFMQLVEVF